MMKKTLTAVLLAAPLALAACGSPEGSSAPSTPVVATSSAVLEESRGTGGSYSADDQVVPADRATTSQAPTPTIEDVYLTTLDGLGVTYTSGAEVVRAGRVVCQFLDEGHLLSDLFMEMAIDPQSERILGPVSNDDLPYVAGAAVPAFCPEHEAAVGRDLGF